MNERWTGLPVSSSAALVRRGRLGGALEPGKQVGAGDVQRLVAVEPLDRIDELEPALGTLGLGDSDGAIELDDRRRIEAGEPGVEVRDPGPVRVGGPLGARVLDRDRGLHRVRAGRAAGGRRAGQGEAASSSTRSQRERSCSGSSTRLPSASTRASRRACVSSISASSPIASGSPSSIVASSEPSRIASLQRSSRRARRRQCRRSPR